jgi:hypothetical protein
VIAESGGMRRGIWSGLLGGVLDGISEGRYQGLSGVGFKSEVIGVLTVPMT